jgi:hypothetical protein
MDEFGSEQALFYSTDGGYKLKQKKNDAGKVVEEQERQAEVVAGAQRKARQRLDCNAQVRHLMDEFGS